MLNRSCSSRGWRGRASGAALALRMARARLVISVRRIFVPAACPLHHPLFAALGARSPSRRLAGEVRDEQLRRLTGLVAVLHLPPPRSGGRGTVGRAQRLAEGGGGGPQARPLGVDQRRGLHQHAVRDAAEVVVDLGSRDPGNAHALAH